MDGTVEGGTDPAVSLPKSASLSVIVISFDALRPDVLGIYGGERGATPNIDAFASESLVFENAYSAAPVTPTSFAAMFSGMLPSRVFHGWQLRAEITLAALFSRAGYTTAAFMNNVHLTPDRGFDRGFDDYVWWRNAPDREVLTAVRDWVVENPPEPFFLWVHFLVPHAPYDVQPGAEHLYQETEVERFDRTSGNTFDTAAPAEVARLKELYLGEVWRADQIFGELLDALSERGLPESSLIILTSDHGEEFREHGGFQHGRLYEEHLRVPLLLYHPEGKFGRVEQVVRTVDLLPTLLGAVDQPVHLPLDGVNLQTSATGRPLPVVGVAMTGVEERAASLMEGDEKLIVKCQSQRPPSHELYDLQADPSESRDLSTERPRRTRDLLRRLGTTLGGEPCAIIDAAMEGKAQTVGLETESVEALRALGYLQ